MLACKAAGCVSNQDTKIDGRNMMFFPFPGDETTRKQWLDNCKLTSTVDVDQSMHLCELHFDKTCFTDSNELKPGVVPTVFSIIEESQRKHKADSIIEMDEIKVPPAKQKKLDESANNLVTPPQSPFAQLAEDLDEACVEIRKDTEQTEAQKRVSPVNGTTIESSEIQKQIQVGKRLFKLTIQIDKIRAKPGPRSKKSLPLAIFDKEEKHNVPETTIETNNNEEILQKISKRLPCINGNCKIKRAMYRSTPAYWCELCNKYYVLKKVDEKEEMNSCSVCYKSFPSLQSLQQHVKNHFVCDMCQTECSSQITYDKHARLHVSTDPLFPYKCHLCTEIFELKEDVKQHYLIVHPTIQLQNTILKMSTSPPNVVTPQVQQQSNYRCVPCNVTFRNEQAYRNHINSHKKKEGLRCNINDTNNIPISNPLTGGQIGILRAVKFSCIVCSKEFDNVGEVDRHTRTHLEDAEEEHKCNICKKGFKTSALLNEHLKHHLSRAHPCPLCPKAFINRTTLKIHLKTHAES